MLWEAGLVAQWHRSVKVDKNADVSSLSESSMLKQSTLSAVVFQHFILRWHHWYWPSRRPC